MQLFHDVFVINSGRTFSNNIYNYIINKASYFGQQLYYDLHKQRYLTAELCNFRVFFERHPPKIQVCTLYAHLPLTVTSDIFEKNPQDLQL
jgi:hypothetical protein